MVTAQRSTCLRRQCGCVLLNARGHVLATGYNGVAAGQPHCNEGYEHKVYSVSTLPPHARALYDNALSKSMSGAPQFPHACVGATAPSGTGLDSCQAIHAEQNALLQCRDAWAIDTCFVTASPCVTCIKLLLNTSCQRIVFAEQYPHGDSEKWWKNAGRVWEQLEVVA